MNNNQPTRDTTEFRAVRGYGQNAASQAPSYTPVPDIQTEPAPILAHVYHALQAKGYDPVSQIAGYLITGDPTYITSYQQARSLICRLGRYEIVEELVQNYLQDLDRLEGK